MNLLTHAKGLREMVRIRGGIRNIPGPGGMLAELIIA